jgi:rhodanese-related sulfurtransferase
VAQHLRALGYDAYALEGGFNAWRAAHPVEPVPTTAARP